MDYLLLDQIFPFLVFGAGALMLLAQELPVLHRLARENLSADQLAYWRRQGAMAWCFFWVGGLWSLQRALELL